MGLVKVGVLGANRGNVLIEVCKKIANAKIVAICDFNQDLLKKIKSQNKNLDIKYFTDYDEFLKEDIDAVVLANYAHQHAPFAIKALKKNMHVYSEVLPCYTMKQAVELVEEVERSKKIYAYGENYCFMPAPMEMKKLYQEGTLGEFEYGEGEYIHNCEPIWADITYGDKNHWRNRLMYSTFYCTHSLGPIIYATGLRPIKVTGFEGTKMERNLRCGCKMGQFGMEIVELENGGIIRSTHNGLYNNSVWYSMYCSKGKCETAREDAENGGVERLYVRADSYSGAYDNAVKENKSFTSNDSGHGGSDYVIFENFINRVLGKNGEIIDVYVALDMFLPGLFAYRSILAGGVPMWLPNLRNKEDRDKYRNDITCCDSEIASGKDLLPPCSLGDFEIPDEVYQAMRDKNKK